MLPKLHWHEREQGDALVFALMALAVGTLLIAPLLLFVNARQKQSLKYYDTLCTQYTSDAGAEYGLWKLTNDPAFSRALAENIGVAQTLPLPTPAAVNEAIPTVEVVCLDDGTLSQQSDDDWVIWAQQNVDIIKNNSVLTGDIYAGGDLIISGNNSVLNGDIYCGGTLTITGENTTIEGNVYCDHVDDVGQHTVMPTPSPFATKARPVTWEIAEFDYPDCPATPTPETVAGEACEAGMYHYHAGDWEPGKLGDPPPGLHYGSGNIVIDDNNVDGTNITMVAEGRIVFNKNKNNYSDPYVPDLVFFSNATTNPGDPPAILIDGNKFECSGGALYAPNGLIELAGNNALFTGASYVAKAVKVTKNNAIIELPLEVEGPEEPLGTCGVYDIRSTVGDTVTTVRIDKCGGEEGELKILSWYVEQ